MESVPWLQAQWRITLLEKGERSPPLVYSGFQGTPDPSQHFPLTPVFKLCAFDHLLGLKIFYAKSSQAPEFKDRGAATFLVSGTLSSALHFLQFDLVKQAGVTVVLSPWGCATLRDGPRTPLPAGGEMDAPCSVPPGRPLPQGSVYTFLNPAPPVMHACVLYSQSAALPPVVGPASPGTVG